MLTTPNQDDRREVMVLTAGVILSILLGIIFYFRSDLNVAVATLAGLVGVTITLQLESVIRTKSKTSALTRQQRVIADMEEVDWLPEIMEKMVAAARHVERTYSDTAAVDLNKRTFEECLARLDILKGGNFEAPFDDVWLMLELTERTNSRLLATSVDSIDLARWRSPGHQRYWNLQVRALERGVKIQRIIVYREWSDEHEQMTRSQSARGVRTLRVHIDRLPPSLRVDTVIWDQACAYESRLNSSGEGLANNYTFLSSNIKRMVDRYKIIQDEAEPWPARDDDDGPYI